MPELDVHARREASAPVSRARTVAKHGVRTLVLAAIAGGTVAFAGVTAPDAAPDVPTTASAPEAEIDRTQARLIASRFESRAPMPGASVELVVDGEGRDVTTEAATVGELLTEVGVLVDHDDVVSAPMTSPVVAGMTLEVTTVDTVDEHVTETDEHATVEEEDASLPRGERRVVTEGVDGVTATTFRVTTSGGEETARELVARAVVSERVDEVVRIGTAEPVAPEPAPSSSGSNSSPSSPDAAPAAPAAPTAPAPAPTYGAPKAIAADMVAARGWGSDQFSCLDALWERESNWNPTAQNPSSGAYGIPQSLPASKMASVAADWRTNPATQITWGLNYISGRYGTPCAALGHSNAVNWY